MDDRDTIDLAEVPADERLDDDGGEGSDALLDGDADNDLADVFADPGRVVEEDLG